MKRFNKFLFFPDDRPDIDLGGPTMLMEPSIHAPANALPASVELYDSGLFVIEH